MTAFVVGLYYKLNLGQYQVYNREPQVSRYTSISLRTSYLFSSPTVRILPGFLWHTDYVCG